MITEDKLGFYEKKSNMDGTDLLCLTLNESKNLPVVGLDIPTYCLNTDRPIVRITYRQEPSSQFIRNHMTEFRGRYVPATLKLSLGKGLY